MSKTILYSDNTEVYADEYGIRLHFKVGDESVSTVGMSATQAERLVEALKKRMPPKPNNSKGSEDE